MTSSERVTKVYKVVTELSILLRAGKRLSCYRLEQFPFRAAESGPHIDVLIRRVNFPSCDIYRSSTELRRQRAGT